MFKNYHVRPFWDMTLAQVGTVEILVNGILTELVSSGVKDTTGAPVATAGKFIPGATIQNAVTGINYQNTGTTASPVWSVIDVSSGGLPALADGKLWIGNGSNVATARTLSGDTTVSTTGVVTISADAVTKSKLAPGVRASDIVVYSGKYSYAGGGTIITISVPGLLSTDVVFSQIQSSANLANVEKVTPSADTITVELDGNPGVSVFSYQALRATT